MRVKGKGVHDCSNTGNGVRDVGSDESAGEEGERAGNQHFEMDV